MRLCIYAFLNEFPEQVARLPFKTHVLTSTKKIEKHLTKIPKKENSKD